jgi:hypothetical protein
MGHAGEGYIDTLSGSFNPILPTGIFGDIFPRYRSPQRCRVIVAAGSDERARYVGRA